MPADWFLYVGTFDRDMWNGGDPVGFSKTVTRADVSVLSDAVTFVSDRLRAFASLAAVTDDVAFTVGRRRTYASMLAMSDSAVVSLQGSARFFKPTHPLSVQATVAGGQATVTWAPPADDGGTPITGYVVARRDGVRGYAEAAVQGPDVRSYTFTQVFDAGDNVNVFVYALNGVGRGRYDSDSFTISGTGTRGADSTALADMKSASSALSIPAGFPRFETTGVPAGTALTTTDGGGLTVGPSDPALYENLDLTAKLTLSSPGKVITLRRCRIRDTGGLAFDGRNGYVNGTAPGLILEDCEVVGRDGSRTIGIGYDGYRAVRFKGTYCEDVVRVGARSEFSESLATLSATQPTSLHVDGAQTNGSNGNGVVRGCSLLAYRASMARGNAGFMVGSEGPVVNGVSQGSPVIGLVIDQNLFNGGNDTLSVRTPETTGSPGRMENMTITRNVFGRDFNYNAARVPYYADRANGFIDWAGNTYSDGAAYTFPAYWPANGGGADEGEGSTPTTSGIRFGFDGGSLAPTATFDTDVTASAITTAGLSIAATADNLGYSSVVYQVSSQSTKANLNAARYFEVTLSGPTSWFMDRIEWRAARGGSTQPRGFVVRSSLDGFAANLPGAGDVGSVRTSLSAQSVDTSGLGSLSGVVRVRFYPYAPAASATLEIDDLTLYVSGTAGAVDRAVTDPVGVTDTVTTQAGVPRTYTDLVGVTDTVTTATTGAPTSGGSGGAFTDRYNQTYTASNSQQSKYHVLAAGIPTSTPAGLLIQLHGDAAYEFNNPLDPYSLGGARGIVAVARARGFITVPALTPDTTAPLTWWEAGTSHALYLRDLINYLLGQYNVDLTKVWLVGYSGGAQQITKFLLPLYPSLFTNGGGTLVYGGGGAPTVTPATFTAALKANFPLHWYTGAADDGTNTSDGYNASADASGGVNWYQSRGFNTTFQNPAGVTHTLDGKFGGILDTILSDHVSTQLAGTGPQLAGTWTATKVSTGVTWSGKVRDASPVLLRVSASPLTGQTGRYTYNNVTNLDGSISLSSTGFSTGVVLYWRIEADVSDDGSIPMSGVKILASGTMPAATGSTQTGGDSVTTRTADETAGVTDTVSNRMSSNRVFTETTGVTDTVQALSSAATQPRLTMTSAGMVQRAGVNYRRGGMNAFQIVHNDYPNSRLMSHSEIDLLLDKMVTLKAGVLRAHTMGANIGPNAPHLVTGVSGTTTPVIAYNSAVWEVMDYVVAGCASRGLYLMVPMTDELGYYHGGKRQWVNFRRPGTVSLDYNVKAANSSTQRTAENYFYTDTQIRADFKQYIADWLNHVNQYTGRAYKNEPAIAIIETGNELWTSAQDAPSWAADLCQYIKGIAPNVLTADGAASDGAALNSTSLDSPYVDVFGTHPYSTFNASTITSQAVQAAAKGKAYHVGEYPWSKTTAPDIEQAARDAGNTFTTMPWSLQNDADLHNGGPGANYGTDDASFYVPGSDSTMQAANTRVTSHSQALIDGAGSAVPPTGSGGVTGDISDTFTGTDGAAPSATRWAVAANTSGSTTTIQSNAVRLRTGTGGGYGDKATLISKSTARTDQRVVFDATPTDLGEAYFQVSLRSAAQDGSIGDVTAYRLEVDVASGGYSIARRGTSPVVIASGSSVPGWGAGVTAHFDFSVIGNRVRAWAWTTGSKPTNPTYDVTNGDATAAGYNGFVLNGGNAATARTVTIGNYVLTAT